MPLMTYKDYNIVRDRFRNHRFGFDLATELTDRLLNLRIMLYSNDIYNIYRDNI